MFYNGVVILSLAMCISTSTFAQPSDAPSTAPLAAPGQPVFRLGDGATPRGYAVRLVIDPSRTDFDGEISIDLRINRPQETLWLNGAGLTVRAASIEIAGERIELASITGGDDFIGFSTKQPLPVGEAKLWVRYQGKIEGVGTRGLFRQQEGPPRQTSCRLDIIFNLGAIRMKDGTVRRSIQEQGGGAVVAAGERQCGRGVTRDWGFGADIGTLA